MAVPAPLPALAVPCTGAPVCPGDEEGRQGAGRCSDTHIHTEKKRTQKVKSNSGQGQRVLSSKTSLTVVLSELETLRNVRQVVMEKSLPDFLKPDEKNISVNRLKQTWSSLLC